MQIFRKAATSAAAIGLLAFGALAASGGSALAATDGPAPPPPFTGCTTSVGADFDYTANCTAPGGVIDNPTAIAIYVDTDALANLQSLQAGQGFDASWTLNCSVNGATVSVPGTYDVTTALQPDFTTIDLQTAVGSPEPNQCAVDNLTVTTALAGDDDGQLAFTLGVEALADTATPGAVYQDEGTTNAGAHASLCADDTANGNSGATIQSFQCLADLADAFVTTSTGQMVHNGDCISVSAGGYAYLSACNAGAVNQEWSQATVGGSVMNQLTRTCLTAPSVKNGVQLVVRACSSAADQKWNIPAATVVSAIHYTFARG